MKSEMAVRMGHYCKESIKEKRQENENENEKEKEKKE